MVIPNFKKRLAKLEGNGPQLNPLPEWAEDFNDFALLKDPSWRSYCTLDQMVIGRAATAAIWWRSLDSFSSWQRHSEPYWWSLPVWQGKTPGWQEQVEQKRRLFCPPENRISFRKFQPWLYSDRPKSDYDRPETWCQPDVGSYTWPGYRNNLNGGLPILHAILNACITWLVDDLQITPAQVRESASEHFCAFKWGDLSRLAQVAPPGQAISSDSPKMRVAEMADWAKKHGMPVDEKRVNASDGIEILELLMSVPGGCDGPHGYEEFFHSIVGNFR